MQIIETEINDLIIIEPRVFGDERGYFFESYNKVNLANLGYDYNFIQDNEALSAKNIFRGYHYQIYPFAQTKLVRVVKGSVLDIVIDIRPDSNTYGQKFEIILSEQNKKELLVPEGFAHGYLSLEDNTIFAYKVDAPYSKEHEYGISFNDPSIKVNWPIDPKLFICSEKDTNQPFLGKHKKFE